MRKKSNNNNKDQCRITNPRSIEYRLGSMLMKWSHLYAVQSNVRPRPIPNEEQWWNDHENPWQYVHYYAKQSYIKFRLDDYWKRRRTRRKMLKIIVVVSFYLNVFSNSPLFKFETLTVRSVEAETMYLLLYVNRIDEIVAVWPKSKTKTSMNFQREKRCFFIDQWISSLISSMEYDTWRFHFVVSYKKHVDCRMLERFVTLLRHTITYWWSSME